MNVLRKRVWFKPFEVFGFNEMEEMETWYRHFKDLHIPCKRVRLKKGVSLRICLETHLRELVRSGVAHWSQEILKKYRDLLGAERFEELVGG